MFLYAFLKKYILINYGSFSGDQLWAALAEAIWGSLPLSVSEQSRGCFKTEHYSKISIILGKQNSQDTQSSSVPPPSSLNTGCGRTMDIKALEVVTLTKNKPCAGLSQEQPRSLLTATPAWCERRQDFLRNCH